MAAGNPIQKYASIQLAHQEMAKLRRYLAPRLMTQVALEKEEVQIEFDGAY